MRDFLQYTRLLNLYNSISDSSFTDKKNLEETTFIFSNGFIIYCYLMKHLEGYGKKARSRDFNMSNDLLGLHYPV